MISRRDLGSSCGATPCITTTIRSAGRRDLVTPDPPASANPGANGMRAIAIAMVSSVALWGASASAAPVNDGRWAVRMVTDAGVCDKSYNYVIAVENGGVRYIPQDSDAPPTVSGHVSPSGAVSLDIRKGIARVAAIGSLCSGHWTAQKRGPVQASR